MKMHMHIGSMVVIRRRTSLVFGGTGAVVDQMDQPLLGKQGESACDRRAVDSFEYLLYLERRYRSRRAFNGAEYEFTHWSGAYTMLLYAPGGAAALTFHVTKIIKKNYTVRHL